MSDGGVHFAISCHQAHRANQTSMFHALKIVIVTAAAHYAAYFVLSRLTTFSKELKQYFLASVVIVAVAVILRNVLLAYLVTAIFCVIHTKLADSSTKIAYFFGLAFTMSYFTGFGLNPGVDLGGLSHPRILILTILLPLILFKRPESSIARFNNIDKAVLLFFVWVALLNFRAPTFTGMMRANLWLVLDYVVPYVAIRRYMSNYAIVLAGLSFALLSQAAVGTVEAILKWHIHTDVERIAGFADPVMAQYKYRGAFLRVQASFMNPLIFALFANMAFLCSVIYLLKIGITPPKTYSKFIAWAGLGISAVGTVSSGSRAGIAGSVIIVILSLVLLWAVNRKRDPKKLILMGAAAAVAGLVFFGGDFLEKNFPYRMRLLDVGSEVVMSNPLFGDPDVRNDPRMQTLHLGEGIIDIVNTYLEFALSFGLPALFLFVYAIGSGLSRLYDSLRYCEGEKLAFGIFAFASLFILAFNLITTSAFGWTYPWIWICIAIGSNITERVRAERRAAYLEERGDAF